ncbi:raffinose/stachyose/melibiose transport system substrate-binding protein [Amycolatopsis pretoriensis]|uniref:Raffinose/stachyose/melibiose transport system substrate-binding protein n=1 Tax=Amycolatopsis pretoriensis TaxID=218821 RepID=A0A1H5R481_9PSEU|nr:extracellular solute-binding protein [Amycolatopsis pretoriensis]SEF32207.1 raffinose/stachyose/melibiose transport system substrate-binding protein [Amycolatopsis pretoriensis]
MKFARTAACLLAATAVTAGCSSGPGSADGGDNALTIAATTNEKPAMDAVVEEYKKANPGLDVHVTYAALDQYQTTVRTQLSSGTAPDVLFVWPGNGNPVTVTVAAGAGYLEDLSAHSWANQIPEGLKSVSQLKGKTYIAPVAFSGIGAVYNTTALTQAGLTAPKTWSDVLAFCAAAKQKGKTAYALGAQTNWVTQLIDYALTPTLVYGPQPQFSQQMTDGKATFAGSGWQTALDKYLQMQKQGCFNSGELGTSYEASLSMVAKGDALGVVQVNSAVAAMKKEAAQGTTFDLQPLPATDDATQTRMAGAAGSSYGMNAKAPHKQAALKFIDWLMSPTAMNRYAETNSALPSIPNDQFSVDPALKTLQQYQKDGKTFPFMDQQWPNARVQQVHFAAVQDLLGGRTTPAEAVQKMDEAYRQGA